MPLKGIALAFSPRRISYLVLIEMENACVDSPPGDVAALTLIFSGVDPESKQL
jgi:hypothetical protein